MSGREIMVMALVMGVLSFGFLWHWLRYRRPLTQLLSRLDLGGDPQENFPLKGASLLQRISKRCLDYEKIIQVQQLAQDRSQQNSDLLLDSLELFVGYFTDKFVPSYINRYGRYRLDALDCPLGEIRYTQMIEPHFLRRLLVEFKRHGQVLGMNGRMFLPIEGERDVRICIFPLRQGQCLGKGYLVLGEDVSRQRRVELNLQNQIALSQNIFDSIPECILMVDSSLTLLFANSSVSRFTGIDKVVGKPISTLLSHQAQADGFDEFLRSAILNHEPVNRINIPNPLGEGKNFVDLIVKPLRRGQRQVGSLILIRDVSEWRELTEEIRSLQSFTDKVINASPYALVSIDSQEAISVWNQSAEALFHKKDNQVMGLNLFKAVPSLLMFREVTNEVKVIGRSQFFAEQELVVDGQNLLVNMTIYPIFNNGTNVVISIEDLTPVRTLQRSLSEAQKMGALGMLTRGIVHDLNNMLTGILGRTSMLKKKIPSDSDLQRDVDIIAQSGERVSELIDRIHQFSRQRRDLEKPVFFNQVVIQTLDLLRPNLQDTKLVVHEDDGDLWVLMDQTKISQIVVNLVVNARDAVKRTIGPQVEVRLAKREILSHSQLLNGEYARLEVADNGSGIEAEHLGKIFEPFFSTKKDDHGTGIGLATVQTLVTEASGLIEVNSVKGEGTVFSILLPSSKQTPPPPLADRLDDRSAQSLPDLQGAVLLVDDEEVVREVGREMLETLGVESLTAADGESGLEVFAANRDRIKLILLDVEMPGMGGARTFAKLMELGCLCPIVIASGYNRDYLERQVFKHHLKYYLAKPFQFSQLSNLLSELMPRIEMARKENS